MTYNARRPWITRSATSKLHPSRQSLLGRWIKLLVTLSLFLILEATGRGLIRRFVDSERRMITSGSVFVFDEVENAG
jgi:Gti1/Pac2 family